MTTSNSRPLESQGCILAPCTLYVLLLWLDNVHNAHPKHKHIMITRTKLWNEEEKIMIVWLQSAVMNRSCFGTNRVVGMVAGSRRKCKTPRRLILNFVFSLGPAKEYCCSLLWTLWEARSASYSGLCRLCLGKLEEKGSQWVCELWL